MSYNNQSARADRLAGVLLGTAHGDSVGFKWEGLTARRIQALARNPAQIVQTRLVPGCRGVVSDDTEHAVLTLQALLRSGSEPDAFAQALSRRLRWWLLCCPVGVGGATLKAVIKLLAGVSPHRSGVCSAGNGPLMRAPVIGVYKADHDAERRILVRISTRMTHTDPRAELAAQASAIVAARLSRSPETASLQPMVSARLPWSAVDAILAAVVAEVEGLTAAHIAEWGVMRQRLRDAAARRDSVADLAAAIGCENGVSGYVLHTLPVALYVWWRFCFSSVGLDATVVECVKLGGDTDSVAALAGAFCGAERGYQADASTLSKLQDPVYSTPVMLDAAQAAAHGQDGRQGRQIRWWLAPIRNVALLVLVVGHIFRRLLPPYRPV